MDHTYRHLSKQKVSNSFDVFFNRKYYKENLELS